MKSLNFNKKSWHYYLATNFGNYIAPYSYDDDATLYGDKGDICTYIRYVFKGLCGAFFLGFLIFALGNLFFETIFSIGFSFYYGVDLFSVVGAIGTIATSFSLICVIIWYLVGKSLDWRADRRYARQHASNNMISLIPKPDGFIKHAYKSWKQKFCVQITFTEK